MALKFGEDQFKTDHPALYKQVQEFQNVFAWYSMGAFQLARDASDHLDNDMMEVWLLFLEKAEARGITRQTPDYPGMIES